MGKLPEIDLQRPMIQKQQENRSQFSQNPNLQELKLTRNKSKTPDNRLAIIAGLIIAAIRRRSIVLNSSLASLPGDTSQ